MTTFTIKAGKHRATPLRFNFWFWRRRWNWEVEFTPSCQYASDGSTNKLCGIGFLPGHHTDSARFGWRYESKNDMISLHAYIYDRGVRKIQEIARVGIGEVVELQLSHLNGSYIFYVGDAMYAIDKTHRKSFCYRLGCYFGGQRTAPHDVTIKLKRV